MLIAFRRKVVIISLWTAGSDHHNVHTCCGYVYPEFAYRLQDLVAVRRSRNLVKSIQYK